MTATSIRERLRPPQSFRWQITLWAAVLSASVAVVLVLVVMVVLTLSTNNAVDKVLASRSDAFVDSVQANTTGKTLVVPNSQLEPGVAVYDSSGRLVAGSEPESLVRFYRQLSTVDSITSRRLGDAFKLRAQPFSTKSGATGVLVLAERLDAYQDNQHAANAVAIVAGVIIVLAATSLAWWAGKRALDPVVQMARTADGWSDDDLEQRFDLGPASSEIRELGHTLNALLAKVQGAILAEQRLTSELAHEIRTPLTAVQGTADLIAMRDDLDDDLRQDVDDIVVASRQMSETVRGLLDLARAGTWSRVNATSDIAAVVAAAIERAAGGDAVEVRDLPAGRVTLPTELAARVLVPVIENATRIADHVTVAATRVGDRVRIEVADDGPGVAAEIVPRLFEPGVSGGGGSGLGLALARRIARSAGGDVELEPAGLGAGATFAVWLPAEN